MYYAIEMALLLLVIPVLITVVTADPQGCCVPWTHSFTLMQIGGSLSQGSVTPDMNDNIMEFDADYHNETESIVSHKLDLTTGHRGNITIINMYKNQTRYIVKEDGTCLKQHLSAVIQPRCTANYTYAGSYAIGTGSKIIPITSWTIMYPSPNALTKITLTADGECTPVSQTMYGLSADRKSQFMSSMVYANFQKDVQNSAKFNIPSACTNPVTIPVGRRELETATGMKYSFLV